jgi:hypothetical protein
LIASLIHPGQRCNIGFLLEVVSSNLIVRIISATGSIWSILTLVIVFGTTDRGGHVTVAIGFKQIHKTDIVAGEPRWHDTFQL